LGGAQETGEAEGIASTKSPHARTGLAICLDPIHVFHRLEINPDYIAGLDEQRHHDVGTILKPGGLERAVLLVNRRSRIRDTYLHKLRKQHMHGPSFHEFHAQFHARQQELGLRPDHALFDLGLFVGLGIHEIALVRIGV